MNEAIKSEAMDTLLEILIENDILIYYDTDENYDVYQKNL
jgi:hypothetical protein